MKEDMLPDSCQSKNTVGKSGGPGLLAKYAKWIRKKTRRGKYALRNHRITFYFINLAFFLLNVITPGGHPWFLYITGAWTAGMLTHRFMYRDRLRQINETENLPELDAKQIEIVQRIHRARRRSLCSTSILGGVAGYLGMINLVTGVTAGANFPWALITGAVMAVPIFIIRMANSSKTHRLLEDLADDGILMKGEKRRNLLEAAVNALPVPEKAAPNQAEKLKGKIIEQLKILNLETETGFESFESLLNQYLHAWQSCQTRKKSLENFLSGVDQNDIILRLDDVEENLASAEDKALVKELNRSKSTLESQLSTLREIQNEKKLVDAREQAIINAMQKTYFDLLKIEHQVASTHEVGMVAENEELGMFIEDLRTSWDELNNDENY